VSVDRGGIGFGVTKHHLTNRDVLGRVIRAVSIFEAAGARTFRVAAGNERNGFVDAGAVIDAAGRHRLATPRAHLDAADVSVDALWITSIIL
jgi:hypothetical protein